MTRLRLPVRAFAARLLPLAAPAKGLLGIAAVAYGTWLVFHPAAFIVAGVLLLADRITD